MLNSLFVFLNQLYLHLLPKVCKKNKEVFSQSALKYHYCQETLSGTMRKRILFNISK